MEKSMPFPDKQSRIFCCFISISPLSKERCWFFSPTACPLPSQQSHWTRSTRKVRSKPPTDSTAMQTFHIKQSPKSIGAIKQPKPARPLLWSASFPSLLLPPQPSWWELPQVSLNYLCPQSPPSADVQLFGFFMPCPFSTALRNIERV